MHAHANTHFVCMCVFCMFIKARGECLLSYSITLSFVPLRQSLSLNLELGQWPAIPSNPRVFTQQGCGYRDTSSHVWFFWVWETWTPCLCSKCFYPPSCFHSLRTHFAFLFMSTVSQTAVLSLAIQITQALSGCMVLPLWVHAGGSPVHKRRLYEERPVSCRQNLVCQLRSWGLCS